MGNRAHLHVYAGQIHDGGRLATFYSHHGGLPHFTLRKLALWRQAHPNTPVVDFVRWALDPANDTNLELHPAPTETGWGDREHDYQLHPHGMVGIRIEVRTRVRNGADTLELIVGDDQLFAAAARELAAVAAYMEHYARTNGWTDASYAKLPDGFDPRPVRAEADRFAALADKTATANNELALFAVA